MTYDLFWQDEVEIEPGISRLIRRPEFEEVDGWALVNLALRERPKHWTFIPEGCPEPEETMGGTLRRFCPLCAVQPVGLLWGNREVDLRRRHYPELCDTFWDCPTCLTTWRPDGEANR